MKIAANVLGLLQKQIANERTNSAIYMHLTNWCAFNGYNAMAEFFRGQAQGELDHSNRFMKVLLDSGYMPEPYGVEAPRFSIKALEDCVRAALKTEQKTTAEIYAIMKAAKEAGDYNIEQFNQWFVDEQREEESLYIDMMDFCTSIGLLDDDTPEWAKKGLRNELEKRTAEKLED